MKISFDINEQADAASAADMVLALLDAFRLANGEMELAPAKQPEPAPAPKTNGETAPVPQKAGRGGKRAKPHGGARPGAGRPRKTWPVVAAAPEPAAAAAPEQLDLLDAIETAKQSDPVESTRATKKSAESIETLREKLKAIAIDKGFLWTRDALAERGVGRLPELTDLQVRELVRACA